MLKKQARTERGFTLIELLVTTFVLATLGALFAATLSTTNLVREARHKDIALKIAANKMEELRAGGYANLPASGTSFSDPLLTALSSSSASTSVTVYNAQTKKVVVSVGWTERNRNALISLTTLITEIGGLP